MTSVTSTLLTIGAFSRASRLSLKALRLYDALGLLTPERVDAQSGYRLYSPSQLEEAGLIGLLRQLEMPLTDIRRVLDAPPEGRAALIRAHWAAANALHEQHRALARYVIQKLEGAPTMTQTFEIHTRELPTRRIATILRRVYQPELDIFLPTSMARLVELLAEQGTEADSPPFVIYHGEVNADSDGPVEVCLPYRGTLTPGGEVTLREEEAHHEAYVTLTRAQFDFPAILDAFDATCAYAGTHGSRGPLICREVYPYDFHGAGPDDPAGEVAWPYVPAGA